jgi:hypothetical protein
LLLTANCQINGKMIVRKEGFGFILLRIALP